MPHHCSTYLVSRHAGTREFLARRGYVISEAIEHLDPRRVRPGDLVIGNLPLHVAAEVNKRGGRVLHLALDLELEDRGRDLSVEEIEARNPRLAPLRVIDDVAPQVRSRPAGGRTLISLLGAPARGSYGTFEHVYRGETIRTGWLPEAVIGVRHDATDPIDRVIVIGTSGSGWDILARLAGKENSDLEFKLFAEMGEDGVSQEDADQLAGPLAAKLGVSEVSMLVVPYVGDADAATQMVGRLGDLLTIGERIVFDVTFGLRDTMLTAFTAITALRSLRDIELEEVVYAAITAQKPDHVAVRQIGAVPQMLQWVEALSLLDTSGDMRALAGVIDETPDISKLMHSLQQDELLLRPRRAAQSARQLLALIQRSNAPLARLFADAVKRRLAWSVEGDRLSFIQASLALQSLRHGDLLRAAALAFEACVSEFGERRSDLHVHRLEDPYVRRDLQAQLNDDVRERRCHVDLDEDHDYLLLRDTRNMMLHTSVPKKRRLTVMFEKPSEIADLIERVCARLVSGDRRDLD